MNKKWREKYGYSVDPKEETYITFKLAKAKSDLELIFRSPVICYRQFEYSINLGCVWLHIEFFPCKLYCGSSNGSSFWFQKKHLKAIEKFQKELRKAYDKRKRNK